MLRFGSSNYAPGRARLYVRLALLLPGVCGVGGGGNASANINKNEKGPAFVLKAKKATGFRQPPPIYTPKPLRRERSAGLPEAREARRVRTRRPPASSPAPSLPHLYSKRLPSASGCGVKLSGAAAARGSRLPASGARGKRQREKGKKESTRISPGRGRTTVAAPCPPPARGSLPPADSEAALSCPAARRR